MEPNFKSSEEAQYQSTIVHQKEHNTKHTTNIRGASNVKLTIATRLFPGASHHWHFANYLTRQYDHQQVQHKNDWVHRIQQDN